MYAGECMHWKSEIDIGYAPVSNLLFLEIGSPSLSLESTDSAGMAVNELWEPDCLKPSEPELRVSSETPSFSVGFEDSDLHPCTLYAQNHLPSAQSTFLNGENRRPVCFSCYIHVHTCREMGAST